MKQQVRITKRCIPGVILVPKNGYYQIRHIGLSAERVKKDPAFNRTRQLANEFAADAKTAKLICDTLLPGMRVKNALPRLRSLLIKARQADTANPTGFRNWIHGNPFLLMGFEFNQQTPVSDVMQLTYTIQKRSTQRISMELPPFTPAQCMHPPQCATHARIFIMAWAIGYQHPAIVAEKKSTTLIPVKHMEVTVKPISIELPKADDLPVLIAVGVQWYNPGPGSLTLLPDRATASVRIVDICYPQTV